MGILNTVEDVLQSMDAYTIRMRIYNQMVRHAEASLKNLVLNDPSWYYHTARSTVVVKTVRDTFYEDYHNAYLNDDGVLILPRRCKVIRIKRLFQLDDNEIDILIKAKICKIFDDRIYFDNRFIDELRVYVCQQVNA